MAEETEKIPQPHGTIKIYDDRGYMKLPSPVLQDLGIESKSGKEIPYISHANCVLLLNPDASLQGIVDGLDVLKGVLELRCK